MSMNAAIHIQPNRTAQRGVALTIDGLLLGLLLIGSPGAQGRDC